MGSIQLCLVPLRAAEREQVLRRKVTSIFISAPIPWLWCRCVYTAPRSLHKNGWGLKMLCSVAYQCHDKWGLPLFPNHWPRAPPPQVTWIYEPKDGERINIAVFHPKFEPNYPLSPVKGRVGFSPSPPNVANPSIEITNVRMNDEGKYICEYATYPIGNEQGITYLVMLGRSQTESMECVYTDISNQWLNYDNCIFTTQLFFYVPG